MIKISLFVAVAISLTVTTIPVIDGVGWKLVFRDEFNGPSINSKEWTLTDNGGFPRELQYYSPKNVWTENGNLIIRISKEKKYHYDFMSGNISTSQSWKYGKFDIRARLPKGKHLWPVLWLMPKPISLYGAWPRSGEIDILEARGQDSSIVEGTIHYGVSPDEKTTRWSGRVDWNMDFSKEFHNFGFEWDKNSMRWFIDGQLYSVVSMKQIFWGGMYHKLGSPFDQKFSLIMCVAVGGDFFEKNNFTTSEADKWEKPQMEIDYVRVYKPI